LIQKNALQGVYKKRKTTETTREKTREKIDDKKRVRVRFKGNGCKKGSRGLNHGGGANLRSQETRVAAPKKTSRPTLNQTTPRGRAVGPKMGAGKKPVRVEGN